MKLTQNVGTIDKAVRVLIGAALIGFGIYLGTWWVSVIGAVLFLTGVVGRCGLYYLLGINTCRTK